MARYEYAFFLLVFPLLALISLRGVQAQSPQVPPQVSGGASLPKPQQPDNSGTISGTVLDPAGAVVQGARVFLSRHGAPPLQSVQTGGSGGFLFSGLPPGTYKITATGPGMNTYSSRPIVLHAGDFKIVPNVVLSVAAAATTVTVTGDEQELSVQQVQIAEQQRMVGGMIPNFYSSYDWNAPPMLAKQKIQLSVRSVLDPISFVEVASIAAGEQYENMYPAYGRGWSGYGKRFGAQFANHAAANLFGHALYPSLFHQDPRYFYKGKGSVKSRILYAISASFVARDDDGRWRPNYSSLLGNFTAGALANAYYPEANRGGSLTLFIGGIDTATDVATNLLREFVFKNLTGHVHGSGKGQP